MKDRELKMKEFDNEIFIDSDGKVAKLLKEYWSNIVLVHKFTQDELARGVLTKGTFDNCLSLTESYSAEFLKKAGYDSRLEKEKNERYVKIRSLNEENRELRKQLGEKVNPEDMREFCKNAFDAVKKWWNIEGLGFLHEINICEGGSIKVVVGGSISDCYYAKGDDYKEVQKKREAWIRETFDLSPRGERIDNCYIVLNDNNISKLESLIKGRFNSVRMGNIEGRYDRSKEFGDTLCVKTLTFWIRDFNDIIK